MSVTPARTPTRSARVAALLVLPYLLLGLAWAMADPAGAGPDETDHLTRAVAVSRLDLGVRQPVTSSDPVLARNQANSRLVEIPARLNPSGLLCFKFRPEVDASCQPAPGTATLSTDVDLPVVTTMGGYPPFLYLPLGLAASTADTPSDAVLRARLVVLAASVLLLFLAVRHLVAWQGRAGALGLVVAVTPLVSFCTGTLTTSAFELCGALGVAAVAVVATRRPESLVTRGTLTTLAVAGTSLVLSRQLGVVTLAALAAYGLVRGGWRPLLAAVRARRPAVLGVLALLVVEAAAVLVWEVTSDHPGLVGPWWSPAGYDAFRTELPGLGQQAVGWFGWLDVRPPWPYAALWGLLALLLVGTALLVGSGRDRADLLVLTGLTLVLAAVTSVRLFYPIGAGLQARHVLPFLTVVPVLAGVVVAERVPHRRLAPVAVTGGAVVAGLMAWGFWLNAQRYAVGLPARFWFLPDARWSPPLGWLPWLLVASLGALLLVVTTTACVRDSGGPDPRSPGRNR